MHNPAVGPRALAVYIATTLDNWQAHNRVAVEFRAAGWEVTYDWTAHGSIAKMDLAPEDRERMARDVAIEEIEGVRRADVVVVLLPGGKGTHTEMGAALALGIPVVLLAPDLPADGAYPSFYRHPLVTRVTEEADILAGVDRAMLQRMTHARPLTFREYAIARVRTAVYPQVHPVVPVYAMLGLAGETGEIAEKLKKRLRDHGGAPWSDEDRVLLRKEIGDVLWYLDALAHDLGDDLETVARENVQKLADRARRDALRGDGDQR